MLRAYAYLHAAHPDLPFGGYYTLGVCQDVVGAIEHAHDGQNHAVSKHGPERLLLTTSPTAEITHLMEAVPKDTGGAIPCAGAHLRIAAHD